VSLDFLSPAPGAVARSPMEREALAAGAVLEQRDGWNVAVRFEGEQDFTSTVSFSDRSHLGKLEVHGAHGLELGNANPAHAAEPRASGLAEQRDGAWWCPYTADRALVLCQPAQTGGLRERLGTDAVDLTSAYGALAISGPLARELFARFTALDLRPHLSPVNAFRPGSVARTPGAILRESEDEWLMLFGAAVGSYVWTVVADAAEALGGGPIGA
jgi:glycine cleavage system aminomethyltransferase T